MSVSEQVDHPRPAVARLLATLIVGSALAAGPARAAPAFTPAPLSLATGTGTYAVATGDFDGDGRLDMLTWPSAGWSSLFNNDVTFHFYLGLDPLRPQDLILASGFE